MSEQSLPEPLQEILGSYCHVEAVAAGWEDEMADLFARDPQLAGQFKQQLGVAITDSPPAPDIIRNLTGARVESERDVERWLMDLWVELYGGEEVPGEH